MNRADHRGRLARGLFVRGLVLMGLLATVHLLGWREHTMILCGTAPVAGQIGWLAAYRGVAYVLCYLLATLVAPVLLIAAGGVVASESLSAVARGWK